MSAFVSICIPSFNRPRELVRLLESIPDLGPGEIEVVVAEDNSPKRNEIRMAVEEFRQRSSLVIDYRENEKNLGFDGNLRRLAQVATGEFVIYMGDDDIFERENVAAFVSFLKQHRECGYVLKTHSYIHPSGVVEPFKYFAQTTFFEPGPDAFRQLFRKSVFVSGFCFKREVAKEFHTDRFDGCLLYQLYLLAEIVLKYPSAFCDIPLTVQGAYMRGVPLFGSSEAEKKLYEPGKITVTNSVNFMKWYFKIARYLDERHHIGAEEFLTRDISKYSYPVIAIQRPAGRRVFRDYCRILEREIGIDATSYYHIYYWALFLFGKRFCDMLIVGIKKVLGRTPSL